MSIFRPATRSARSGVCERIHRLRRTDGCRALGLCVVCRLCRIGLVCVRTPCATVSLCVRACAVVERCGRCGARARRPSGPSEKEKRYSVSSVSTVGRRRGVRCLGLGETTENENSSRQQLYFILTTYYDITRGFCQSVPTTSNPRFGFLASSLGKTLIIISITSDSRCLVAGRLDDLILYYLIAADYGLL